MILKPNLLWKQNQGITLPSVLTEVQVSTKSLFVNFSVEEPIGCFRAEIQKDNDCCWEDSCVEIFLKNPINPEEYYNFEITSRGFILAALGKNRENRQYLPQKTLNKIQRNKQIASVVGDLISWAIAIHIPVEIFGLKNFTDVNLYGNLYKCADKAKIPHYLSAFPIETEKPDFHRPEFFKLIHP